MIKKIAIITDVHGNLEALTSVLEDIKKNNFDEIICLGDSIDIGPNSKECIDLLIENNVKSVLGNHEIYLLRGTNFDSSIVGEEKEHYDWVKESLTEKEINYIKNCPLYFDININYKDGKFDKKYILCHYLLKDEKAIYPFEPNHLKKDIELWKKYNKDNITYLIGHLHNSFNINDIDGISGDYIEETDELTNIEIVDSAGCSKDEFVSYASLEICKSISLKNIKVIFDREKFINKVMNTEFLDKKNILKYFYGIEI